MDEKTDEQDTAFGGFADVAAETPGESVEHELEATGEPAADDGQVLPDDGLPDQIAQAAAEDDSDPLAGAIAAMPVD